VPVRPRRRRRARQALTLRRFMDLTIGPNGAESMAVLAAVFAEHRRRFDGSSWGARYFDQGIDDREGESPRVDTADGLPGI
jgi:hypothetical protein